MQNDKTIGQQLDEKLDQLATKGDLESVKAELKADFDSLRAEVKGDIAGAVREILTAMNGHTNRLRTDLNKAFEEQGLNVRLKSG